MFHVRSEIMSPRLLFLGLGFVASTLLAQDPDWVRDWESAQHERPAHLSAHSRIAPANEPGDPLVLQGHVFLPDGVTPVAGAVVFAYQTDAKGLYQEAGIRGWRLKGWAVTDKEGGFQFVTIRPAPYPARTVPAHIHLTVTGGGVRRQWTEELRFKDDPLLSANEREHSRKDGEFGNVRPVRHDEKTQRVEFSIRTKSRKDF